MNTKTEKRTVAGYILAKYEKAIRDFSRTHRSILFPYPEPNIAADLLAVFKVLNAIRDEDEFWGLEYSFIKLYFNTFSNSDLKQFLELYPFERCAESIMALFNELNQYVNAPKDFFNAREKQFLIRYKEQNVGIDEILKKTALHFESMVKIYHTKYNKLGIEFYKPETKRKFVRALHENGPNVYSPDQIYAGRPFPESPVATLNTIFIPGWIQNNQVYVYFPSQQSMKLFIELTELYKRPEAFSVVSSNIVLPLGFSLVTEMSQISSNIEMKENKRLETFSFSLNKEGNTDKFEQFCTSLWDKYHTFIKNFDMKIFFVNENNDKAVDECCVRIFKIIENYNSLVRYTSEQSNKNLFDIKQFLAENTNANIVSDLKNLNYPDKTIEAISKLFKEFEAFLLEKDQALSLVKGQALTVSIPLKTNEEVKESVNTLQKTEPLINEKSFFVTHKKNESRSKDKRQENRADPGTSKLLELFIMNMEQVAVGIVCLMTVLLIIKAPLEFYSLQYNGRS